MFLGSVEESGDQHTHLKYTSRKCILSKFANSVIIIKTFDSFGLHPLCKQVIDFDKSTTTVKEERNKTLQHQTTDKFHHFQVVTLAPNWILLK